MKQILVLCLFISLILQPLYAVEGMYLLNNLPLKSMRKAGLRMKFDIDPQTGYAKIAAGVVNLNGASASFISPEGLILTNHHVAFSGIQLLSTLEDNILEKGFLARNRDEERHVPRFRASITTSFEDVTPEILHGLTETMNPVERYDSVDYRIKRIIAREEKGHEKVLIRSFYNGKSYYLIRRLEFNDVRLVYTPPRAIGEFGGNIDNWMWPRHTGDFTILRVYADSENNPAEYSENNIPYQPIHYFPLSVKGLKPGDFTMILGYPGRTQRYLTAREAAFTLNVEYPEAIRHFEFLVDLMDSLGAENPEKALKFASRIKGLNNYQKKYQGMLDGLKNRDIVGEKQDLEEKLRLDDENKVILHQLDELQEEYETSYYAREQFFNLQRDPRLVAVASDLVRWNHEKKKPDLERERGFQQRDYDKQQRSMAYYMSAYDETLDKILLHHHLTQMLKAPASERIPFIDSLFSTTAGKSVTEVVEIFVENLYSETQLMDPDFRQRLLDITPKEFNKIQDPLILFAHSLEKQAREFREEDKKRSGRRMVLMPHYFDALKDFMDHVYPDANGTLRCTYGHIQGYSPADAIWYEPFTTLTGVWEKDRGEYPFIVPESIKSIRLNQNNQTFYDKRLQDFPVNFLHTMDITNGNSGSAVFDKKGRIVGIAFDGNYEAMTSDWIYDDQLTRAISVDIRYLLLNLTDIEKAENLLNELTIIQ
ncbi:MAG: hypothetical protein PWP06_1575 [Candidatus Marinimicrobia bacterium]|nr:hypothetical protein [Candidatus Neomarinimicrobiota bacterium]